MHRTQKDFLWTHLKDLPYFRALLRAVEARFYQEIELTSPVLDLGCGDGHFASIAFDRPIDAGMDPWRAPLMEAARLDAYRLVLQGSGAKMPFFDSTFASVISNSVLEHIPDIDPVLEEVVRVLQPGGIFVFCVPNQNFTKELSIARRLEGMGLPGLAEKYRVWFNKISRHHHCDSAQIWKERLDRAGMTVERHWDYFSPAALQVLEWGHYFGLPSLVAKKVFDRWILMPKHWNLDWLDRRLRPYYLEDGQQPVGCYSFYITRKPG